MQCPEMWFLPHRILCTLASDNTVVLKEVRSNIKKLQEKYIIHIRDTTTAYRDQ